MNIFLIFLLNFLLKLSIEEINNNKRIEGAIKSSLSGLENIPIKNDSIIFKYEKYKIICNDFKIMNPDLENISLSNYSSSIDSNNYIYFFENIKFLFVFNLKIIHNSDFEIEENNNNLEINCLKFNYKFDLKNDFLYFDSVNISGSILYYLNSDVGIDNLDYYKEAREKKKCLYKLGSEENYIEEFPEIAMKHFLKNLLSYYISGIEFNDIMLTYDINQIFSNSLVKIDNLDNNIEYIKINKILIPFDKIETLRNNNERKLLIHQIKFFGIFNLTEYDKEYEFNFELNEEKQQNIELFNRSLNFNFDNISINSNFDDMNKNKTRIIEILKYIVMNNYSKILIDSTENYYFI